MNNSFWSDGSRGSWHDDREEVVYLGRAVCLIGKALYPQEWRDDDFVYLGAKPAAAPVYIPDADEAVNFLRRIELASQKYAYARAEKAFRAGVRGAEVADFILAAAVSGRIKISARPIRGGSFMDTPTDYWDRRRSLHIFRSCTFSQAQPFNANPPVAERHDLFVERTSLNGLLRTIPGGIRADVTDETLRNWVRENTASAISQTVLLEMSKTAFPNYIAPSRERLVNMDKKVRSELDLPARVPGRPAGR